MDRPAVIAALRARLGRMGHAGQAQGDSLPLSPAIDRHLPQHGLPRAAIHEVLAADPGAAAGFCALLLARSGGSVLWIAPEPDAWPPGLARFGLSPANLVLVQAPRRADGLWAMEESLRCPGVSGSLLAITDLDLTAARRLQLAAEAGGGIGLLLRPDTENLGATAAHTRWRIQAIPGNGPLGNPHWQLDLLRCRGGQPGSWQTTWHTTTDTLATDHDTAEATPARRRAARP